jgi:hypothetical protein
MKNKGFTLIEVILYIALFTLLIGTAFATAYQIIDGTNKININTNVQDEGNFVMRKVDWALSSLDPATPPTITCSACLDQALSLHKISSPTSVALQRNSSNNSLEISENGGTFKALTTVNVKVTRFQARIIPALGSGPTGITATTTINGIDFAVTKYFRK